MEKKSSKRNPFPSRKAGANTSPLMAYLPPSLLYTLLGWGGIAYLWLFLLPTVGVRWLFFLFLFLALTGTAMPLVALLNWRFSNPPAGASVITRQAIWFGVYGCLAGWMQISRVLTPSLALILALGFSLIEWLIRLVELTRIERHSTRTG